MLNFQARVEGTYADGTTIVATIPFKAVDKDFASDSAKSAFCQWHYKHNTKERMTFGQTKVLEITEVA